MSREAELYKDKIEVSLDGRQIFYLFFGGAVIVGLVFVLGVMVGRRVEARGHTDRARVAATVDPLAALDRLEGGTGLSFQGALRGAEGPITDVEKKIAAKPAPGSTPAKIEKKADEPKPEPKQEAAKVDAKKLDAKAEPKQNDAKASEPAPAQKAAPKHVDEAKQVEDSKQTDDPKKAVVTKPVDDAKKAVATKPVDDAKKAVATKPVDDTKKVDATKKLDEPNKDDAKKADAAKKSAEATKPAEKKADDAKKFTLQLSSFQDKAEAQAYLDSMKSAGYQAYVTQAAVDGKQYFRVRLGSYRSMEAATEAKAQIEKSTKKSAIVIKL